jgi:hypothetical protein
VSKSLAIKSMTKRKILNILLYLFTFEKALQHLFTGLFFIVNIPGIGTPDMGTNFQISNSLMALFNFVYFVFFVLGILGMIKKKNWATGLIIVLALLDIILEFIFHHFFFITVSVIASLIVIIISMLFWRDYFGVHRWT